MEFLLVRIHGSINSIYFFQVQQEQIHIKLIKTKML